MWRSEALGWMLPRINFGKAENWCLRYRAFNASRRRVHSCLELEAVKVSQPAVLLHLNTTPDD
jgi:hypothetical protein